VNELQGIARFKFHEGKLDEFKRYSNDDQSECIVHERLRGSEALIEHAAHLGNVNEAMVAAGFVSGELLGEPSAELRAKMADSEVGLFTPCRSV
jgi:hypothetical protein